MARCCFCEQAVARCPCQSMQLALNLGSEGKPTWRKTRLDAHPVAGLRRKATSHDGAGLRQLDHRNVCSMPAIRSFRSRGLEYLGPKKCAEVVWVYGACKQTLLRSQLLLNLLVQNGQAARFQVGRCIPGQVAGRHCHVECRAFGCEKRCNNASLDVKCCRVTEDEEHHH